MKTLSKSLLILIFLNIVSSNIPNPIYSRLDARWKDYKLADGSTIGYRPEIIDYDDVGYGSTITLTATVLDSYKISCDGNECDPLSLYKLYAKYEFNQDDIDKALHIKDHVTYDSPDEIKWDEVNDHVNNADCGVLFYTKPVKDNVIGMIYEIDMNEKTFKYYDDLGKTNDGGKFDDVVYIDITIFDLSGSLRFLA
jgi:hypothetical protein